MKQVTQEEFKNFIKDKKYRVLPTAFADCTAYYSGDHLIGKVSWPMYGNPEIFYIEEEEETSTVPPLKTNKKNSKKYKAGDVKVIWNDIDFSTGWVDDTLLTIEPLTRKGLKYTHIWVDETTEVSKEEFFEKVSEMSPEERIKYLNGDFQINMITKKEEN